MALHEVLILQNATVIVYTIFLKLECAIGHKDIVVPKKKLYFSSLDSHSNRLFADIQLVHLGKPPNFVALISYSVRKK